MALWVIWPLILRLKFLMQNCILASLEAADAIYQAWQA
jgi:hypothetical protein